MENKDAISRAHEVVLELVRSGLITGRHSSLGSFDPQAGKAIGGLIGDVLDSLVASYQKHQLPGQYAKR